ncbi:hypothetical protein [Flagellimonas algarum]|uniref:hypothetical protein n=1 Tax=Flagellimonas algarum TaxID=3230298 RepID=UPI003CD0C4B6
MDELELLKKDWQKQEAQLPKLSYEEIYKMIWKKSSSMVKWIFYISVAEFLFWIAMAFLPRTSEQLTGNGAELMRGVELSLEILSYLIIIYFIFKFYQNYKQITVTDSARNLMKKIIVTRKTVMQYVWFNLILFSVMMIVVFFEIVIFNPDEELASRIAQADQTIGVWFVVGALLLGGILFFAFLLWLFYRLIYGILLKRLNDNYNELKKLEV